MKRGAALVLLGLLLIETYIKASSGVLAEMLWTCFPAALLLALGVMFDLALLSASGFIFHLCIALPAYLLHLASSGETNWASVLIHFLSPALGLWVWRGRELPRASSACAAGLMLACTLLAYLFTSPEMNINLAFKAWQPVAFLGVWGSYLVNTSLLFVLLLGGQAVLNRWWGRSKI